MRSPPRADKASRRHLARRTGRAALCRMDRTAPNVSSSSTPRRDTRTCCGMWARRAQPQQGRIGNDRRCSISGSRRVRAGNPGVRYVRDCFARVGRGLRTACEALAGGVLRPLVPRITTPTMLVVCGTEDIPEFIEAANWLHAQITGSKLQWLSPARHCSIWAAEAFNRLCRDFPIRNNQRSQIVGLCVLRRRASRAQRLTAVYALHPCLV